MSLNFQTTNLKTFNSPWTLCSGFYYAAFHSSVQTCHHCRSNSIRIEERTVPNQINFLWIICHNTKLKHNQVFHVSLLIKMHLLINIMKESKNTTRIPIINIHAFDKWIIFLTFYIDYMGYRVAVVGRFDSYKDLIGSYIRYCFDS